MSASGDLSGIGAPTVVGKCPDQSGEPLLKCLQGFCSGFPELWVRRVASPTRANPEASVRLLSGVWGELLHAGPEHRADDRAGRSHSMARAGRQP